MLTFLIILTLLLILASTWWFGLWSNLITLVNLIFAGMVATSFYANLAGKLMALQPTYRLMLEFIALWLVFAITFFVLRGLTDVLTRMRLKFDPLTEIIGRSLLSLAIACVFISFALFSLHLGPLPSSLFPDSKLSDFTKDTTLMGFSPDELSSQNQFPSVSAIGPDTLWSGFVRTCSRGSFSASREQGWFAADNRLYKIGQKTIEPATREFDPLNAYYLQGVARRELISGLETLRVPAEK
jgi:uncharacterized membrane protein required for colicin V production